MGGVALGVIVNGSGLDDLGYCRNTVRYAPKLDVPLEAPRPHTRRPAGGSFLLFESLPNIGVSS